MKLRKEFDSIGSINVPNDKYWGASTQRSNKFFNIGKILVNISIIKSIAIIKRSAALVHAKDKLIDSRISKAIIKALRRAGAKKISMLITYPQINYPCYAGIDFPSQEELATFTDGKEMTTEEITEMVRKSIGVDFLGYNDAENLADAVGMPKDSMCFTCSSGNYDSLGIKPDFTKREQVKAKI